MAIHNDFSNKILDYLFGRIPFTPAVNYYLGVSTTPIAQDGTGITEPSDTNYDRVKIANDKKSFTNAEDSSISISTEFRFKEAGTNWGNIVDYFITDASDGKSTPLIFGHLQLTRNVEIGTTLILSPYDFGIQLHTCEEV